MAGVFLSYDRDDVAKARAVALSLEKAGHSVWWDQHIRGGSQYSKEIEQALKAADAVVVLWSSQSIDSPWVRDEAAAGRDSGRLVPVMIDGTEPPLGFRQYQTIDMSGWKGRGRPPRFQDLLTALGNPTGDQPSTEPTDAFSLGRERNRWARVLAGIAAMLLLATAAFFLLRGRESAAVPTVAVRAAEPAAEPLARDLLVKLATLQSAKSGSMRLMDQDPGRRTADLIFDVGGNIHSPKPTASLVLIAGKGGTILWSNDFDQQSGSPADLKQQTAFTAARVLGCALEGLSAESGRLPQTVLKLYLNACALLGETYFHDPSQAASILQKVTEQAPRFEPAWAKLMLAETIRFQSMSSAGRKASAGNFRRTIAAARRVDADIPEAYVAEIELLPGRAFYDQVRLIDRAAKADPDNVFVLAGRSLIMLGVGRLEQAVEDARRAARLDPLSPAIRSFYIQALIYSGQIETARSELAEAERLWPGATTILDARYRLNLRYGNVAEAADALKLMQSGTVQAGRTREAFIRARLDPTSVNVDRAVELAKSAYRMQPEINTTTEVIFTLGEFDRTKDLSQFLLVWEDTRQIPYFVEILFRPPLADLRADRRFMQIAARFGLLDYWRRSGNWPDFCSDPELPYDCKKEAAKLTA